MLFFFLLKKYVERPTAIWVSLYAAHASYLSSRIFCCWSPGLANFGLVSSDSPLVGLLDPGRARLLPSQLQKSEIVSSNGSEASTKSKYESSPSPKKSIQSTRLLHKWHILAAPQKMNPGYMGLSSKACGRAPDACSCRLLARVMQ